MITKRFPKTLYKSDELLREYKLIYILPGQIGKNYAIYFDTISKTSTERIYINSFDNDNSIWYSNPEEAFIKYKNRMLRNIQLSETILKELLKERIKTK